MSGINVECPLCGDFTNTCTPPTGQFQCATCKFSWDIGAAPATTDLLTVDEAEVVLSNQDMYTQADLDQARAIVNQIPVRRPQVAR